MDLEVQIWREAQQMCSRVRKHLSPPLDLLVQRALLESKLDIIADSACLCLDLPHQGGIASLLFLLVVRDLSFTKIERKKTH